VAEKFEGEKGLFLPLPVAPYDSHEILAIGVPKRPFIRFDGNEYSVPAECVGTSVTLHADEQRVLVEMQGKIIAKHERSWDKGQRVSEEEHHRQLRERKRMGQKGAAYAELVATIAGSETLLERALASGENIGSFVASLQKLRRQVGNALLGDAVAAALAHGASTLHELRRELDALQMARREPPPPPVLLPLAHPQGAPMKEITRQGT
jgi:hypothetical protein